MNVPNRRAQRHAAALMVTALLFAGRTATAQDTLTTRPLSLGDAARLASRQSASALEAAYRADQALARVTQERAVLLPSLSTNALESGTTINTATFGFDLPGLNPNGELIGPVNTLDVRAHLSQTLVDLGALGHVRSARASARARGADAANIAQQAATVAAVAYLETQRGEAHVAARMADSVLADSLVAIAHDQLAAGVGVALDLTRAESQAASVRAQLIAARNERDRARLNLLRALGLPLDAPLQLADSLSELPISDSVPDERAMTDAALLHRPDVRAVSARLAAAEQSVAATKSERLPSLSAFGNEGYIGTNDGSMLNTYTWGVQLSVPIFDGLHREGRIQEAQAMAKEIDVQRRDLRQQVGIQVHGAVLDLHSAREQLDAAGDRLRLSEQAVAQARDRFRAGVSGNLDVITASIDLNSARNLEIDALTAYQSARVSLARAQGSV
ncbi:MAG: TolC family protein, partial [Gemmatimonadaceae bacterium]